MRAFVTLVLGIGLLALPRPLLAQPAARLSAPRPAAALGTPITPVSFRSTARAASPDPLVGDYIPAARLGPISEVRFGPDPDADSFSSPQERYNWGLGSRYDRPVSRNDNYDEPRMRAQPSSSSRQSRFGEKFGDLFDSPSGGNGGGDSFWSFESDHCFDDFISPVSNPFLFEDPRTLTEIRPIFMYQTIPNANPLYHGGNVEFFGLQARLALTQRFSIVMNKLGGIAINPGSGSPVGSAAGFSEVWIGPKYTWYREDQTGTVSAMGLIFQIPTGPGSVYQNTGNLSLTPYMSIAQRFGKTSWGTFNFMDTAGLAFATTGARSNYFYNSAHIDFDVANWQRIYPLLELNWFYYTSNGNARPDLGFEGQDIANTGAALAGTNFLNIAIGGRYKFSEAVQIGLICEFPLLNDAKRLENFRLGLDAIWRY